MSSPRVGIVDRKTRRVDNNAIVVHPVAAKGFDESQRYDRGRPGYPPQAVDWLRLNLGLGPGKLAADVASGTGKLTGSLAEDGSGVIGLEPVAAMRRQFLVNCRSVPCVGAVAERLPLRSGCLDAITVAQAFHWFDAPRALEEFHRVLRPQGRVGLIWNVRDRSVDWIERLWQVMDRVERHAPWRDHDRLPLAGVAGAAGFGPIQQAQFHHVHSIDRQTLVDRFCSVSHVAVLPEPERQSVIDEVLSVVDEHPSTRGRPTLPIPYRVDAYWMERI